jgi:hypothetical protein
MPNVISLRHVVYKVRTRELAQIDPDIGCMSNPASKKDNTLHGVESRILIRLQTASSISK